MRFFINQTNPTGGPGIFGNRLAKAIARRGHEFTNTFPLDLNISFITGEYYESATNLLRLDGLYLDSGMPEINRQAENAPIFDSYNRFDKIIFQSEFSKKVYEAFTGTVRPNEVIHNGVPITFNPFDRHEVDDKVIIASASWRRHKRLEEAIEAFKSSELKHVKLVVLNAHDYVKKTKIDVPDNVQIMGSVPPHELYDWYQRAHGMIHLCWLDSCPNSVVEALACGTPVLCSHNGGTKELIKHNGVVIKLEEDYHPGKLVDLYNPPKVNLNTIVEGVHELLETDTGFYRKDLEIRQVAQKYIDTWESAAG